MSSRWLNNFKNYEILYMYVFIFNNNNYDIYQIFKEIPFVF